MGGELQVDSAAGRGSCFSFTLRLGLQPGTAATTRPDKPGQPLRGTRVLVIDDNAAAREVITRTCRALGLEAEAVAGVDDALQRLQRAESKGAAVQLLLVDAGLPGLGDPEAAAALGRRAAPWPQIPVVPLVSAAGRDTAQQGLSEGLQPAGPVLVKPVTPARLIEACAAALGVEAPCHATLPSREPTPSGDPRASLRGARILLVEDNEVNQEVALALLGDAGIDVSVADNGQAALEMLERHDYDAVLMDCQMPVMDGYAATRALRQLPRRQALPVIAMTANAMVGDRDAALAAGMNDHITKPINVNEMFATLARWVAPESPRA
jgi:CheY-like chemotaxis protein